MKEYLGRWEFWVAVVVVTFISHWAFNKFMPAKGS